MTDKGKLITLAIHTYEHALSLKEALEKEGIQVIIHNVNLSQPVISSGVRVRIHESDLPLALHIIEQPRNPSSISHNNQPVVIPIDFSEYSLNACAIGFDFAKSLGAKVVLLHTFIGSNFSGSLPFESDRFKFDYNTKDEETAKAARERLDKFAEQLTSAISRGKIANAPFDAVIREGVPEDCIIDFSKKLNASLVVMGTRGKNKKRTDLIGSVTAEVLDAGKFPVFTVPEENCISKISDIGHVAFFSNLSQQDLISLDAFARLFKNTKLNVSLIPVEEKKSVSISDRNNAVMEYCNSHYPQFAFTIKEFADSNFINEFSSFIAESKIDLIIIPNKKRNMFARLFNPSVAHKMLFLSDTPLLVVPI